MAGYYKDETEFLAIVEEDAFSFRPPGQLIHSYTRPSSNSIGKRNPMKTRQLDTQDADSVTFEVYHVVQPLPFLLGMTDGIDTGNLGNTGFQGIPPTDAVIYLVVYRGRILR